MNLPKDKEARPSSHITRNCEKSRKKERWKDTGTKCLSNALPKATCRKVHVWAKEYQ